MAKTKMLSGPTRVVTFQCPVKMLDRMELVRVKRYTTRSSIVLSALDKYLREIEAAPTRSASEPQELR
jgi:hypothetical protein